MSAVAPSRSRGPAIRKRAGAGSRPRGNGRVPSLPQKELARLLELSQDINGSLELGKILARVVAAARNLLDTDMSTVLILDEGGERLEVAAADGVDDSVAEGLSTPVGENLAGQVARTGKPRRCCDVPGDPRSKLPAVREAGITSAMLAPLSHDDRMIGVLAVETRKRRRFTVREQDMLQLLANHAATALEKARLYRTERSLVEELSGLVSRVNSQCEAMSRSRDAHERLTRVALEDLGLSALTDTAAELTGTPIALVNQFGCLMHASSSADGEDVEELWEGCRTSARFEQQLENFRENSGLGEPGFIGDEGFWRIVPVAAAGEVLGFIVALGHERLGEVEVTVLEQASSLIATELLRERGIAEAEARMHGDILRSLLFGGGEAPEVRERAALLGHDLTAPQCVVIACQEGDAEPLDETGLGSAGSWASAQTGLRSIHASIDGCPVALLSSGSDCAISRESAERWAESFGRRLAALGRRQGLRWGISPVADPPDVQSAYTSARQALVVSELEGSGELTHFEDVELIATLAAAADRAPLQRFVARCIGGLQEYDERRGSSLAETLEVYLDNSGVARHAAKALYLHPHSLRYRLSRIEEIQGIDLKDPMVRLMTHLALKLRTVM